MANKIIARCGIEYFRSAQRKLKTIECEMYKTKKKNKTHGEKTTKVVKSKRTVACGIMMHAID